MKSFVLLPLAAGMAMLAGNAFAQDSAPPPAPPPAASDAANPGTPPPPPTSDVAPREGKPRPMAGSDMAPPRPGGPDADGPGRKGPGNDAHRGKGPRDNRHSDKGSGHRGPQGDRNGADDGRGPKAAHFRIEQGDVVVDVKCAEGEPMRLCADIASRLLRDVGADRP